MARPPLAAMLSLCLAAPLSRAWALATSPVEPSHEFTAVRNELLKSFCKDVNLTTANLGPLLEKVNAPDRAQILAFYEQAKRVQSGREPRETRESFLVMVSSVARQLGVYCRPARGPYSDLLRMPDLDITLRLREIGNIDQAHNRIDSALKLPQWDRQWDRQWNDTALAIPPLELPFSAALAPALSLPTVNRQDKTPPAAQLPPATPDKFSWSSLKEFFDWPRGRRLAREILVKAKGFKRRCYAAVKKALRKVGILKDEPIRPGKAAYFAQDANQKNDPTKEYSLVLNGIQYRRVDTATIVGDDASIIPDGTILNYAAGCAGFSKKAGHIEVTVSRELAAEMMPSLNKTLSKKVSGLQDDEVLACSDGCSARTLDYIRTYGEKGCLNMYVPVRQD